MENDEQWKLANCSKRDRHNWLGKNIKDFHESSFCRLKQR